MKALTEVTSMATRALVYIYNVHTSLWVALPTPSDYNGSSSTLVNSARNTQGEVIGDVIKSDVAKIELRWNYLTLAQYTALAKLFEPLYNGAFFNAISFFDVIKGDFNGTVNPNSLSANPPTNRSGANPCKVFYPNDRKVAFAKLKLDNNGKPIGYTDVSLNLIDTGKYYGE